MQWNAKDLSSLKEVKEYIDTAIVPLLPISLKGDMVQTGSMVEFTQMLSMALQVQFTGRTLLFPPFTYWKHEEFSKKSIRLQEWEQTIQNEGFTHIFYFTSDLDWKHYEAGQGNEVLVLPTVPLESMEEKFKHSMIQDQVKQFINLFVQKWQQ
ncbi:YpiF family protein [Bacillus carboniphilus]|uniref:YpiF family protein n=1 Tax=Bacillus carboniphilus TaxID=86663 RepID=A0ABP3GNM7_9BACI